MGQLSRRDLGLHDPDVRLSSIGKRGNGRIVTPEAQFDVFSQDDSGPMWRQCFEDLEGAKTRAQELAIEEGLEFFVFTPRNSSEVARFFPNPRL